MRRRKGPGADRATARNMRLNGLNAATGAVALNMIQPFIAIFAIRLGATNQELGSLSSLPNLLSIPAALAGGWLLSRGRGQKGAVAAAFLASRLLWLLVAAVPWVPAGARVTALIAAWAISLAPHNAAGTGVSALLAELFPGEERGRALAIRQSAATAAGVGAGLLAGWLLDRLPYPHGYQWMFAGAALLGMVEVTLLWCMREGGSTAPAPGAAPAAGPVAAAAGRRGGGATGGRPWSAVLRHAAFLRFTAASAVFNLSWQMVWPLFARFQVSELGATNTWVSVLNLANAATNVASAPYWMAAAARWGNRRLLILAAAMLAVLPGLNALAPDLYWLIPVNMLGGVGTAGVMLLMLNALIEVTPAAERPLFMAVNAALVATAATAAPLAGGLILDRMPIRPALMLSTTLRILLGVGAWVALERAERCRQEKPLASRKE